MVEDEGQDPRSPSELVSLEDKQVLNWLPDLTKNFPILTLY